MQIRSAVPELITNIDSQTGSPLIYFTAETLEGEGLGNWTSGEFLWWKDTAGAPQIAQISADLAGSNIYLGARRLASNGSVVAIRNVAGAPRPLLAGEIKFFADNINLGFDLPISGDKGLYLPNYTSLPGDDNDHKEWWTVVARTATTLTSNVNTNIRVVFESDAHAQNFKLVVPTNSQDLITVSPPSGTALTAAETLLTITGKNPTPVDQRRRAEIQIKSKSGNALVRTLNVDLLPVRKIKLGIYFVSDYPMGGSEIPVAFQKAGEIIGRLNDVFKQACVEFEIGQTGIRDIYFDKNQDGALEGSRFSSEWTAIASESFSDKLNLLIVRKISNRIGDFGVCPSDDHPDRVVVETKEFEGGSPDDFELFLMTCAHEIGHALGLSTRNRDPVFPHIGSHDSGAFPSAEYYLDGSRVTDPSSTAPKMNGALMRKAKGKWRWIRQEDWKEANDNAASFEIP